MKKRGAPRKRASEKMDYRVMVNLTLEDFNLLEDAANEIGIGNGTTARMILIDALKNRQIQKKLS